MSKFSSFLLPWMVCAGFTMYSPGFLHAQQSADATGTSLLPDLVVETVSVYPQGDGRRIRLVVRNAGYGIAPASTVAVFQGPDSSGVPLDVPALPPGSTHAVVYSLKEPFHSGQQLTCVVDSGELVDERNEVNNQVSFMPDTLPVFSGTDQEAGVPVPSAGVFGIVTQNMQSYPTHEGGIIELEFLASARVDPSSLTDEVISVTVSRYSDEELVEETELSGDFVMVNSSGPPLIASKRFYWKSEDNSFGTLCSTQGNWCRLDVRIAEGVMSEDGRTLDGDGNGISGGEYLHSFYLGK